MRKYSYTRIPPRRIEKSSCYFGFIATFFDDITNVENEWSDENQRDQDWNEKRIGRVEFIVVILRTAEMVQIDL